MQSISQRLKRRTSSVGADPLITYYDLGTGERTELSAITVSNWVDKTCNLLSDEHGLAFGDVVLLDVARTHPGHWVTACLELACWRLGATVAVDVAVSDPAAGARLVVAGPDYPSAVEAAAGLGADLLACSLHPLGLPFAQRLPVGVADYALEARGQPDRYAAAPVPAETAAWWSPDASLTQADLAAATGTARRRLLRPSIPWPTVRDGLLAALMGGGSVVVVVDGSGDGDGNAALERIRATENVEEEVGQGL